jgi:hypothetical protein
LGRKRTWVIENTWNCSTCGHKNRGRDMRCANCGKSKEGERYAIPNPETAPEVKDADLLRMANAGANWTCPYCGCQERDLNGECKTCAAKRGEGFASPEPSADAPVEAGLKEPPVESWPSEPSWQCGNCGTLNDQAARACVNCGAFPDGRDIEPIISPSEPPPPRFSPRKWLKRYWPILAGAGAVIGITGLLLWIFLPREVEATVKSISWNRSVELQQDTLKHGEGWESSMPSRSFNSSCERRQRGTRDCNPHDCNPHQESYSCNPHDCNCHTTCSDNGNGFSTCSESCSTCYDTCYRTVYDTCYDQCPVYEDWCTYDYYEWVTIDTRQAGGTDHKAYWPQLTANGERQRLVRSEKYQAEFTDFKKFWKHRVASFDEYLKYKPGARWLVKVNRAGSVWPLHPLAPLPAEKE